MGGQSTVTVQDIPLRGSITHVRNPNREVTVDSLVRVSTQGQVTFRSEQLDTDTRDEQYRFATDIVVYDPKTGTTRVLLTDRAQVSSKIVVSKEIDAYGVLRDYAVVSDDLIVGVDVLLPANIAQWPGYQRWSSLTTDPWLPRRASLAFHYVGQNGNVPAKRLFDLTELLLEHPPTLSSPDLDASRSQWVNNPLQDHSLEPIKSLPGIAITGVDLLHYDPTTDRIVVRTTKSTCHHRQEIYQVITLDPSSERGFLYEATGDNPLAADKQAPMRLSIKQVDNVSHWYIERDTGTETKRGLLGVVEKTQVGCVLKLSNVLSEPSGKLPANQISLESRRRDGLMAIERGSEEYSSPAIVPISDNHALLSASGRIYAIILQ